jgi:hypothetical protein
MAHKLLMLALMLGILILLIAGEKGGSLSEWRFLWAWKFSRRDVALSPREATLTYQQLLKALRKEGFRKSPSQTPREFALSFLGTRLGPIVMEFTELYNLLRFGQAPVSISRLRSLLEEIGSSK